MSAGRQPGCGPRPSAAAAIVVVALFIVALGLRLDILSEKHTEGDEMLYAALVQQLDEGRGYTLRGHPILDQEWVAREQYDRPLFHHPPGGIGLFWALQRWFGQHGLGLAQLVSFSVFYWSMLGLGRLVLREWTTAAAVALAGLAAFTPIVAHVHTHFWLDGPQVAFSTAGAALYLLALSRRRLGWAALAGLMLAWACATKLNAVLALPAVVALGWSVAPDLPPRRTLASLAIVLGIVAAALVPWMWAQLRVYDEVFPSWAGKPTADLIAANTFIQFVTVARGPWSYLRLLPQAAATLVPALLALPWMWRERRSRRIAAVLVTWIASILLIHVALGYVGYSKLLRYVILVTPATILLFALAVESAVARLGLARSRRLVLAWLVLGGIGFAAEVSLGVTYIEVYSDRALIVLYPDIEMRRAMTPLSGPG